LPDLALERFALGITYYVVLLFSLSVHECAHGFVALRMGDDTAAKQGRISLNPFVHIDPLGTVLLPIMQFFFGGIPLLAWAKPTPVEARNFKEGRFARAHVLVWGAGPASNILLSVLFGGLLFAAVRSGVAPTAAPAIFTIIETGIVMNAFLALFNLVPLPPLDGSWLASWSLPRSLAARYERIAEPYGQWILLALLLTGALEDVLRPFMRVILKGVELLVS
jgi:Zn-dependent protease